jgi:hypothetical protein
MDKKPYPSELQDRFIVRFPDGMRDRIAEAAKANNRSMNSEIIARLQASFDDELPDRTAEMLLHGELGATVKSVNNTMRHLALLSKRLQVESLRPVHFGGGSAVQGQAPGASGSAQPATLSELMEKSGAKDLGELGDSVARALNPKRSKKSS